MQAFGKKPNSPPTHPVAFFTIVGVQQNLIQRANDYYEMFIFIFMADAIGGVRMDSPEKQEGMELDALRLAFLF